MIDGMLSGVEVADEDRVLFVDVLPNSLIGGVWIHFSFQHGEHRSLLAPIKKVRLQVICHRPQAFKIQITISFFTFKVLRIWTSLRPTRLGWQWQVASLRWALEPGTVQEEPEGAA